MKCQRELVGSEQLEWGGHERFFPASIIYTVQGKALPFLGKDEHKKGEEASLPSKK